MACPDQPRPRPRPPPGPASLEEVPWIPVTHRPSSPHIRGGGADTSRPNPVSFFSAPHTSPSLTRVSLTRGPMCCHVADMLRVCVSLQGPLQQPDRLSHLRDLPGPPQASPAVSAGRGRREVGAKGRLPRPSWALHSHGSPPASAPSAQGEPKIPSPCSPAETYLATSFPVCSLGSLMSCPPLRWCEYPLPRPLLPSSAGRGTHKRCDHVASSLRRPADDGLRKAPPSAVVMAAGHRRAHARGVCLLQPQSLPGAPSPPREPREPLCSTLGPSTLCRDFGTEFLTCDCRLRWLLPWARNRSLQLSERTLCAYPSALHAQALAGLQEVQLRCGEQTQALKAPSCRAPTDSRLPRRWAWSPRCPLP